MNFTRYHELLLQRFTKPSEISHQETMGFQIFIQNQTLFICIEAPKFANFVKFVHNTLAQYCISLFFIVLGFKLNGNENVALHVYHHCLQYCHIFQSLNHYIVSSFLFNSLPDRIMTKNQNFVNVKAQVLCLNSLTMNENYICITVRIGNTRLWKILSP